MEKLTGIVVCGGKSSRMSTDKSLLNYHGVPHRYHLYHLLEKFCTEVFLSVNEAQSQDVPDQYKIIVDKPEYENIGPMAALLSAWQEQPGKSWLLLGCDYPFIDVKCVNDLVQQRKGNATCYMHSPDGVPEPLITIYENEFYASLMNSFKSKRYSLSKLLEQEKATMVRPYRPDILRNINTVKEYLEVVNKGSAKTYLL